MIQTFRFQALYVLDIRISKDLGGSAVDTVSDTHDPAVDLLTLCSSSASAACIP